MLFIYLWGGDTMRIIGRFPDARQVSAFVDSSRHIGLDRKDMIISNLANDEPWSSIEEASKNSILIKSETDDINHTQAFSTTIKDLEGDTGIVVAVKVPKHTTDKVRSIMEQSGAVEIIQD
jgi:hypothetical protein